MADLKSRGKEGAKGDRGKRRKFSRGKGSNKDERGKRRHGPGLPNVLRKQIALQDASDSDAADSDVAVGDLYEYEQGFAEEESKKNKRYDPVENYLSELHELPEDFKVSY